jgi:hypothetical protein
MTHDLKWRLANREIPAFQLGEHPAETLGLLRE